MNSQVFKENNEIILSKDYFSELVEVKNLGSICNITQGVVQNPDKVSSRMASAHLLPLNSGVFVLNKDELTNLHLQDNEMKFVKDFYDDKNIKKYTLDTKDKKHLLYLTKETCSTIDSYENISNHLFKYKKIMDNRRETIKGSIKWFQLHWPRTTECFENEKIVMATMFKNNSAVYLNDKSYFGMSTNIINLNDKSYNLKYILAILNSSFAKKWFYTHGKHRGVGVDIGVTKLRMFPIHVTNVRLQDTFIQVTDIASSAKLILESSFMNICYIIDALVFQLYFSKHMIENEIDILKFIERDLIEVLNNKRLIDFNSEEQIDIINNLVNKWTHPDSEVNKRINSFESVSPDILKPFLES
jgi:adenine-specific DNA-methyltransferase